MNNNPMNSSLDTPVFLVGAERSGTTLLRLMLDNHPGIIWQSEFEFAVDCIDGAGNWPSLEEYYDWLGKDRIFIDTGFAIDKTLSYPELIKSFLSQKAAGTNAQIIGATCHRHFDHLLTIWPQARFIHILRDPRDVAKSNIRMAWAGNVWHGADRWIEAEHTWEKLSRQLPTSRQFEFHYEDLIANPPKTLTAICEFLGISYSEDMLDYSESSTYSPPDMDLRQQWKEKLSSKEVRQVEYRVGELLEQKGYQPSGLPKLSPSWLTRKKLWLHNQLSRRLLRIRQFGFFLVAGNFIARKCRFSAIEDWTLRKIHAIERANLK